MLVTFEPPIDQQKKSTEESLTTGIEETENTINRGLEIYVQVTQRKNEILTKLTKSKVISSGIVKILTDRRKSRKNQSSLTPWDEIWFTINPPNPKLVIEKQTFDILW